MPYVIYVDVLHIIRTLASYRIIDLDATTNTEVRFQFLST